MAYISQYEIDMGQDRRNQQNQAAIAGAIVEGLEQNRRRALEAKRAEEAKNAQAVQFASNGGSLESIRKFQAGDSADLVNEMSQYAGFKKLKEKEDADLNNQVKRSTIAANEAAAKEKALPFEQSREGQAYAAKAKIEQDIRAQNSANDFNKDIQKDFTKKNIQLASVKTAMDAALAQLKDPNKSEEEKVKVGQGLLKLLNSAEGADAVGAEESKRIGGYLEYQKGNFFDPGKFWGRDMEGFISQVQNNSDLLADRIKRNEQTASGVTSGKTFTEVVTAPKAKEIPPQIQQKIQNYTPEQKAARLQQLKAKQQQAAMR